MTQRLTLIEQNLEKEREISLQGLIAQEQIAHKLLRRNSLTTLFDPQTPLLPHSLQRLITAINADQQGFSYSGNERKRKKQDEVIRIAAEASCFYGENYDNRIREYTKTICTLSLQAATLIDLEEYEQSDIIKSSCIALLASIKKRVQNSQASSSAGPSVSNTTAPYIVPENIDIYPMLSVMASRYGRDSLNAAMTQLRFATHNCSTRDIQALYELTKQLQIARTIQQAQAQPSAQ